MGALRRIFYRNFYKHFREIKFHIIVRGNNRDIELLKETVASVKNAELHIDCNCVAEIMLFCDLAILAPGGKRVMRLQP